MIKDFIAWHALKQKIDNANRPLASRGYKERDVWWISLGHNVGFEENGKGNQFSRPVVVVKGFSSEIFWGVPLTSKPKTGIFYYSFTIVGKSISDTALLSQLRVFDTKRMTTKIGAIKEADFWEIKKRLRGFLK